MAGGSTWWPKVTSTHRPMPPDRAEHSDSAPQRIDTCRREGRAPLQYGWSRAIPNSWAIKKLQIVELLGSVHPLDLVNIDPARYWVPGAKHYPAICGRSKQYNRRLGILSWCHSFEARMWRDRHHGVLAEELLTSSHSWSHGHTPEPCCGDG